MMIGDRGEEMEEQEQEMRCVRVHGAGALAELICVLFKKKLVSGVKRDRRDDYLYKLSFLNVILFVKILIPLQRPFASRTPSRGAPSAGP